jgi:hypothetical protein
MSNARNHDRTYGHIDLSTGDEAAHVLCSYSVFTSFPTATNDHARQEWAFKCRMPRTVADALTSSDWDFVLRSLDTRPQPGTLSPIEATIFIAKCAGMSANAVQEKVSTVVEENLFKIFGRKQIKAGNKAWLVPRSLVRTGNPNG